MSGTTEVKHAHFRIPRGLPGVNAVDNDVAVATYLSAEDSETHTAFRGVAYRYSGDYNLTLMNAAPMGGDWTTILQSAIDDVGIETIVINEPISISTVAIPPNRPLTIRSEVSRNIVGQELITILPGGSGIRLDGDRPSLVVSVKLEGLSFTSDGEDVVGAITGQDATGIRLYNLTFNDVGGSAIDIKGIWYDSSVTDVTAMDCGRAGYPVIGVGDAATDANRVTFTNLRTERSATTQVYVRGAAYSIDFVACKFHSPVTDGSPLFNTDTNSKGVNVIGGQLRVNTATPGMQLRGAGHAISALTIQGDSGTGRAGTKGVYGSATRSSISDCTVDNVEEPVNLTGDGNIISRNKFTNYSLVKTGNFGEISSNIFTSGVIHTNGTAVHCCEVGAFGVIAENRVNGFSSSPTMFILINNAGTLVRGNVLWRNATGPGTGIRVGGPNPSNSSVVDNVLRGFDTPVGNLTPGDSTRIIANNQAIPL